MGRRKNSSIASKANGLKASPPEPETLTNREIREINDWGYTIIPYGKGSRTFVKQETRDELVEAVLEQGEFIFNNADNGKPGDGTRLQLVREWPNLPGRAAKVVSRKLERTFPHLEPGEAQFLLSLAHGHDQRPHTDVTAGYDYLKQNANVRNLYAHVREERIPLSVILTFEDKAFLHVWPASMTTIWAPSGDDNGRAEWSQLVEIPPYSALIFRQDLVHAGTKYSEINLRVHFYMDLKAEDYKTEKGHTMYVDRKFWKVSKV